MGTQEQRLMDNVFTAVNTPCDSEMILDSYEQIQDDYVHVQDLYDHALACCKFAVDRYWIIDKKRNRKLSWAVSSYFMYKIQPAYECVHKYRYFDGNKLSLVTDDYKNQYLNYQKASKDFCDLIPELDTAYNRFYRYVMGKETIVTRINDWLCKHRKR